jgi:hypothetical protein
VPAQVPHRDRAGRLPGAAGQDRQGHRADRDVIVTVSRRRQVVPSRQLAVDQLRRCGPDCTVAVGTPRQRVRADLSHRYRCGCGGRHGGGRAGAAWRRALRGRHSTTGRRNDRRRCRFPGRASRTTTDHGHHDGDNHGPAKRQHAGADHAPSLQVSREPPASHPHLCHNELRRPVICQRQRRRSSQPTCSGPTEHPIMPLCAVNAAVVCRAIAIRSVGGRA